MTEDEQSIDGDKNESPLNKQMSPFAGGALFGGLAFAFIIYRSHDFLRALMVGAVVFAILFWIMWAGQYMERRNQASEDE